MPRPTLRWCLGAALLAACTRGAPSGDDADNDPGPNDPTIRAVITYDGANVVDLHGVPSNVVGAKVADLVLGQTYELSLVPTLVEQGGRPVYELAGYRTQVTLIGTPSVTSEGVLLDTINGNTWELTGSFAQGLVTGPRYEPPAYQPAAMTVTMRAFAAPDAERARVASWDLVPTYRCYVSPVPVVRLQLANITADHALDLEEWMTYRGEFLIGTGTCTDTAGTYACVLDSWGGAVRETWTFPAPAAGETTFDFTTAAVGAGSPARAFGCQVVVLADMRSQSDG